MTDEQITYPDATKGYYLTRCSEERCGRPQDGAGRPRKGWVQLKAAAETAVWFCGWYCASRYAIRRELGGFTWPAQVDATLEKIGQDTQRTHRRLTPELLEDVAELEQQGYSLRQACERLDVSRGAVDQARSRARRAGAA